MKILGIDEAGRGALIGPLVIGGFMINDEELSKLEELGVTDSKQLTSNQRAVMYEWLKSNGESMTIKISPLEIDMKSKAGVNLNSLEINKMINIINTLKPDKVIIDSPSANKNKVINEIKSKLEKDCELIVEFKADEHYRIVGAGSVLAKHERDEEIKRISSEVGEDIGAGYPSDERTIRFAIKSIKNKKWLNHIRHSWSTYERLRNELSQKKIIDY